MSAGEIGISPRAATKRIPFGGFPSKNFCWNSLSGMGHPSASTAVYSKKFKEYRYKGRLFEQAWYALCIDQQVQDRSRLAERFRGLPIDDEIYAPRVP